MPDRDAPATDRIPPQDLDAEQAVLGACLLGGSAIADVSETLTATDFYRDAHRTLFAACLRLHERGEPLDLVTAGAELRTTGQLDAVGGFAYLDRLLRSTPLSTNAARYAAIVAEKAVLRGLLTAARVIEGSCFSTELTPAEVLEQAEGTILGLRRARERGEPEPAGDIAARVYGELEQRFYHGGPPPGVMSGYADLDRKTHGFKPGQFVVVGARPSMGKTALVVTFAINAATRGKRVAIFSLEMTKEEIAGRMLSNLSGIGYDELEDAQLDDAQWERMARATNDVTQAGIHIDDTPGLRPGELRSRCRRLAVKGLDLVIIDYLQLMVGEPGKRDQNREQEISGISRALKGIAKDLGCPVVACAQLSRALETRGDKRPILSDLRDSGQIEQDCDLVLFLYRDSVYHPPEGGVPAVDPTEVIIAKQRNGPTGVVTLGFLGATTRFVNYQAEPARTPAPERDDRWNDR